MSQQITNIKQDVEILKQAVNVANSRGVYTLEESATIYGSITRVSKLIEALTSNEEANKEPEAKMEKVEDGPGKDKE